jgi:hypothetical protein
LGGRLECLFLFFCIDFPPPPALTSGRLAFPRARPPCPNGSSLSPPISEPPLLGPQSRSAARIAANQLLCNHVLHVLSTGFGRSLSAVQRILLVHCVREDNLAGLETHEFDASLFV